MKCDETEKAIFIQTLHQADAKEKKNIMSIFGIKK